jgi:hypothetical protein
VLTASVNRRRIVFACAALTAHLLRPNSRRHF